MAKTDMNHSRKPDNVVQVFLEFIRSRIWKSLPEIPSYLVLITVCTITIIPFLWMFFSSFKPINELTSYPPKLLPERWTLGGYKSILVYPGIERNEIIALKEQGADMTDIVQSREAFSDGSTLWGSHLNALKLTVFTILGKWIMSGLAGYAFAKIKFRGREALFILTLSSMMIPWMTILLPQFVIFQSLGWVGTQRPLFMPELLFGTAFSVFFFRQHFRTIPNEILESAVLDGASHWQIFWYIMMPLSKSVMGALLVFTMLSKWNSLMEPLLYLTDPKDFTPVLVLWRLVQEVGNDFSPEAIGIRMAGAVLIVLPILVVFFFAQQYFIAGLTQGAIKE